MFRRLQPISITLKPFTYHHHHHHHHHKRTSSSFSSSFKRLIPDLNLKYTIPSSLILSVTLWFYLKSQLPHHPPSPLKITEPLPPVIRLHQPNSDHLIDPSTGAPFPTQLSPSHLQSEEPLRLIGLGVRTVSFFSIKVYVAALYVDPRALRALRVIPGWNNDLKKDQFLSTTTLPNDQIQGESLITNLLNAPVHFAIRIAPVRNTDFTHLRDGFCRSLTNRIQLASKAGKISEIESRKASLSINTFRSFFPTGVSVPKGKTLTLIRTGNQTLIVEYDGKKLGELDDSIIANQLILAYFADQNPISPKFKESVAEGFSSLYTADSTN